MNATYGSMTDPFAAIVDILAIVPLFGGNLGPAPTFGGIDNNVSIRTAN